MHKTNLRRKKICQTAGAKARVRRVASVKSKIIVAIDADARFAPNVTVSKPDHQTDTLVAARATKSHHDVQKEGLDSAPLFIFINTC